MYPKTWKKNVENIISLNADTNPVEMHDVRFRFSKGPKWTIFKCWNEKKKSWKSSEWIEKLVNATILIWLTNVLLSDFLPFRRVFCMLTATTLSYDFCYYNGKRIIHSFHRPKIKRMWIQSDNRKPY